MLVVGFIKHVEEATQLSPIVVVFKKNEKFKICVDFRKLIASTKKDPYSLSFINKIINTIAEMNLYIF